MCFIKWLSRIALAAMLIVMIHEKEGHTWEIALERIGCVIVGSSIVMVITSIFGYFEKKSPLLVGDKKQNS